MTVRPITTIGDPVLRAATADLDPAELASPEIQQLIDDLIDTRRAARGAGLAAPQISVSKRIAVVEVDQHTRYAYKPPIPLTVIVNPRIDPISDEKLTINEGCLSVPDLRGDVERLLEVRVHHLDRHGEPTETLARGLTAGTFQHEIDHLDGIVFLDRVTDPRTLATWEQFERHSQAEFLRRVAPYTRGAS
jgi:peptide deformylase